MIGILNSGAANIRSVENALQRLKIDYFVSDQASELATAERIIFPGVGHAAAIMDNLRTKKLIEFIRTWHKPFLGICLGMQVLFDHSEEGDTDCLGIISGNVKKFAPTLGLKIPQMGWNQVRFESEEIRVKNCKLSTHTDPLNNGHPELVLGSKNKNFFRNIKNKDFFYFVHSYRLAVGDYTVATTEYGEKFSAVVQQNNFIGVQFHPEKSGKAGEQLLQNFCNL